MRGSGWFRAAHRRLGAPTSLQWVVGSAAKTTTLRIRLAKLVVVSARAKHDGARTVAHIRSHVAETAAHDRLRRERIDHARNVDGLAKRILDFEPHALRQLRGESSLGRYGSRVTQLYPRRGRV